MTYERRKLRETIIKKLAKAKPSPRGDGSVVLYKLADSEKSDTRHVQRLIVWELIAQGFATITQAGEYVTATAALKELAKQYERGTP